MALTRNKPRVYSNIARRSSLPLAAASSVLEGAAIGLHAATGRARSLVAGDLFVGFARAAATTLGDRAGAPPTEVQLVSVGEVELAVSGVTAANVGDSVFASDDDTFALGGRSIVGEVLRVPAAGRAVVAFKAAVKRLDWGASATTSASFTVGCTAAEVQAACTGGNVVLGFYGAPGTIVDLDQEVLFDDHTTVILGDGVEVRKQGTGGTQVFSNRNKTGGNTDIRIFGNGGTINGNRDNVTAASGWSIRNWNAVQLINVQNAYVGGWLGKRLHIKDPYKYLLHAGALRDFHFADLHLSSAGAAEPGQDGIHLAGLSRKGVIERCYGSTQDDFIAINPRAVPLAPNETMPQAMGPIRELTIRDIYGSTRDRAGNVVALYGCVYDDAAQTVFDGSPDAASPTSTRPAITGITHSGGIATAITNKPHRMVAGDIFQVSGANPTGYNTDPGLVLDAPTPTSFRYIVNDATGAYVSGATLTIYWHLDNITVDNVRGNTFQSNILALQTFGEVSQTRAVFRGIKARGITGDADTTLTTSTNTAVLMWRNAMVIDSIFENISTAEGIYHPLFSAQNEGGGKDACRTVGTVVVRNIFNQTAYSANQNSGQGPIYLAPGRWEGLVIDGFTYQAGFITGSWRHGASVNCAANSSLTFRNGRVIGTRTDRCNLASVSQLDATSVVRFENCSAETAVESIVDVKEGAGVTGGLIVIDGGDVPVGSTSTITCYGSGVTFQMIGGHRNFATAAPPVRFLSNAANCSLYVDPSVLYGNAAVATITGTGPYAITGMGAKINVADAKVSRVDGAIVYNTNAAAGTLGAAGLVVGQGTAANSWRLMGDPSLRY